MNILKRLGSLSGPVMRVLIGIGSLGLLIIGLKQARKHSYENSPAKDSTRKS